MKKGLLSVAVLVSCMLFFAGCIKNTPYITTIDPSLSATIGTYNFVASAVTPATLDTQTVDTTHTLIVTGYGSDRVNPYDKIVVAVSSYKGKTGTFSIVQGQAGAAYFHNGIYSPASGGIVAITSIGSNSMTGYFSFTTLDGLAITNGKFTVGLP